MPEAVQTSLLHKLRFTPMGDLLRGRLTARLHVSWRINDSDLPAPAKQLIWRVVQRTRLFRREKIDVAEELIAHFRDGLESGASVEELIERFGDEKRAAKLIRRAKKRNRPLVWHAIVGTGWIILGLLAVYGLSALYYFTAKPSPSVNYVAMLNSRIENVPQEDRAWPLYRQAILGMRIHTDASEDEDHIERFLGSKPGDLGWTKLTAWLDQHARELELVREASRKPVMGFVIGPGGSAYDRELWPKLAEREPEMQHASLVQQYFPPVNALLPLTRVLWNDVRYAGVRGDSQRVVDNVAALLGMARQVREHGMTIADLVGIAYRQHALLAVRETLQESPDLLSRDQLQRLAHMLAKPDAPAELISFRNDRLFALDFVQQVYSDDGQGSGRVTAEGLRVLKYPRTFHGSTRGPVKVHWAILPMSPALMISRRELLDEIDRLYELAEANLHRPLRDSQWDRFNAELAARDDIRSAPLQLLIPDFDHAHDRAERHIAERDAVLVGIALELYRREHGRYPDSLEELTPTLLPAVPLDPFIGDPLKYRAIDGYGVVYSVGVDGIDDGGRPRFDQFGRPDTQSPGFRFVRAPPGDWIIYTTAPESVIPWPRDDEELTEP